MAKRWAKGNAPAQGGTPHRMTKPVNGVKKLTGKMSKGKKAAAKKGTSPLDGRKRGGKK